MLLNDNSNILDKRTRKMKMMKTTKKRKALWIYDPKKTTVTMVVMEVLVKVVLLVVLLVEVLAKKCRLKVEVAVLVKVAEVALFVLEAKSWEQGE